MAVWQLTDALQDVENALCQTVTLCADSGERTLGCQHALVERLCISSRLDQRALAHGSLPMHCGQVGLLRCCALVLCAQLITQPGTQEQISCCASRGCAQSLADALSNTGFTLLQSKQAWPAINQPALASGSGAGEQATLSSHMPNRSPLGCPQCEWRW